MVGPGHAVQGTHAGVLGSAVLSLVGAVFVGVEEAEKLAFDYFVAHTVDNLAVAVAAVAAAHGKEIAAAAVVVVAVTGDLKKPADFPIKEQISHDFYSCETC